MDNETSATAQDRAGLELTQTLHDMALDYGVRHGMTSQQVLSSVLTVAISLLTPDGRVSGVLAESKDPDVVVGAVRLLNNGPIGVAAHLLVLNQLFHACSAELRERESKRDAAQYN